MTQVPCCDRERILDMANWHLFKIQTQGAAIFVYFIKLCKYVCINVENNAL